MFQLFYTKELDTDVNETEKWIKIGETVEFIDCIDLANTFKEPHIFKVTHQTFYPNRTLLGWKVMGEIFWRLHGGKNRPIRR